MTTQTVRENRFTDNMVLRLVAAGVMAAVVCVVTIFRIPLGQSKVHFANSMCLLSGLLMGPVWGGAAAGLGSALYDLTIGGYGAVEAIITFVTKFAMAWVTGILFRAWVVRKERKGTAWKDTGYIAAACVLGALAYVALYMLKSFLFKMYVEPVPRETIPAVMIGKLIPSLINAVFAVATAPLFYHAVCPALKSMGILKKLQ